EQQFQDAINTALGSDCQATAPVPGPIVPGQRVTVDVSLTDRGSVHLENIGLELVAPPRWQPLGIAAGDLQLSANRTFRTPLTLIVPEDAPFTRPYFERASIRESRYTIRRDTTINAEHAEPA